MLAVLKEVGEWNFTRSNFLPRWRRREFKQSLNMKTKNQIINISIAYPHNKTKG